MAKTRTPVAVLDRANWEVPAPDDPALARITVDLRALAVPTSALTLLPGNYHKGDVPMVAGSIERFTQRKPIVVNRLTGHVEAGNTTLQAMVEADSEWVAVVLVEDDPATELAYAVTDNRAQEMGYNDTLLLSEMLTEIREADFELFETTGYDDSLLNEMLAELNAANGGVETGHVEFDTAPQLDALNYRVIVECENESQQGALLDFLRKNGWGENAKALVV